MNTWETLPNGQIAVNGDVITFDGLAETQTKKVVADWYGLAKKHADANGIPVNWILAIIQAESAGNPNAISFDGGKGLTQITSVQASQGNTDEYVMVPDNNIRLSAEYVRKIKQSDLVRTAAAYNAGSARFSESNPYGLVSTAGYLDRIVRANNTIIPILPPPGSVGETLLLLSSIAFAGWVYWRYYRNR